MSPIKITLITVCLFLVAGAGLLFTAYWLATSGPASLQSQIPLTDTTAGEDLSQNHEVQELQAGHYERLSREFEEKALDYEAGGELKEARAAYLRAATLQQKIDAEFPNASAANPLRSVRLMQVARNLEAEPLHRESQLREEEAEIEAARDNLPAAIAKMRQALAIHEQILREFLHAPQASMQRLTHLESRILALETRRIHQQIVKNLEESRFKSDQQDFENASRVLSEAMQLQLTLNQRFPDSPYASVEKVRAIQTELELLQSEQHLADLLRNRAQLRALLATRQVHEARPLIERLADTSRQLMADFPLSRSRFEPHDFELTYLQRVSTQLETIQDWTYDILRPLPEFSGLSMAAAETPQWVFAAVSGANPSRFRDPDLPVDSATLAEAEEFCTRLGWILGLPVSLPEVAHFRATVSLESATGYQQDHWCRETSDGRPRAFQRDSVSPLGFQDLLGNLTEWIQGGDGQTWGGHFELPCEQLEKKPLMQFDPTARHHVVGFRIVVDRKIADAPEGRPSGISRSDHRTQPAVDEEDLAIHVAGSGTGQKDR